MVTTVTENNDPFRLLLGDQVTLAENAQQVALAVKHRGAIDVMVHEDLCGCYDLHVRSNGYYIFCHDILYCNHIHPFVGLSTCDFCMALLL